MCQSAIQWIVFCEMFRIFTQTNRNLVMNNYFIRAIVFMAGFAITYLVLDLVTGDLQSFREYVRQTVIVGVLVGIGWYLNDKGWNSWKKIGGLFKRKKTDK